MPDPLPARPSADFTQLKAESSVALLMRAREGDEAARDALYARYLPRLRRLAHGRLPAWARDHLDTEDLVQDTLLLSVRRLPAFSPQHERAFCAYVWETLQNRVRDVLRRAARRPAGDPVTDEMQTGDPSPLDHAMGGQTLRRYECALTRLKPTDRELVIARVELDLDYHEIADLQRKPSVDATRMAVSRALVKLATEMAHARPAPR